MKTNAPKQRLGEHAIVIGGSIGGLLSARVLSDFFREVTILDRDAIPDSPVPRKGVPHGGHVHVIFGGGVNVINRLYPGFFDELVQAGSTVCDFSKDLCWYHAGVWKARPESNLTSYWQTRPFLEAHVRRRTGNHANVRFLHECNAIGLLANTDRTRVTGVEVQLRDGEQRVDRLEADLVVDASGRGSQLPRWLESLGYTRPVEDTVEVNIGYASRIYEPTDDHARDWQILAVYGTPPNSMRTGYIFPIEGGRWLVSEVGFLKSYPPDNDDGYLDFARGMEIPDFYEAIKDAQPLTAVSTFKFPANRWRRYERLSRFPRGLLVIGDAISTFNPVYGQGMSACALEVDELRRSLERGPTQHEVPGDLANMFFHKAAQVIAVPWMLATQADFLYPQTRGRRSLRTKPLNWYLLRVLQLCSGNERIVKTFYEVLHFIKKPTALFHPFVVSLVLRRAMGFKGSYRPSKVRPRLPEQTQR